MLNKVLMSAVIAAFAVVTFDAAQAGGGRTDWQDHPMWTKPEDQGSRPYENNFRYFVDGTKKSYRSHYRYASGCHGYLKRYKSTRRGHWLRKYRACKNG